MSDQHNPAKPAIEEAARRLTLNAHLSAELLVWLLIAVDGDNVDEPLEVLGRAVKLGPELLAIPAPRRDKGRDRQFLRARAKARWW